MSKYLDRARELRAITEIHYNCCQSVVVPFAEDAGIPEETVYRIAANYKGGMKMGAACGAIAGGLMVLGMFGVEEVADYYKALRESHNGMMNCADLLRVNKELGREKKPHCDEMVYECVGLAERILREKGKI